MAFETTPVPSLPAGNLPVRLSTFVGRERECIEVIRLLTTTRLLTLVGTGGIGKTRLALEAARTVEPAFFDGVRFVELGGLSDPALVAEAIASDLGLSDVHGQPLEETLTAFLRTRHMLLVLDNCEHLLVAAARIVAVLLRSPCAENLRVLATSRQALGVEGETVWRVPSLDVPDAGSNPGTDEIAATEGVRLFCQRAQSFQAGFVLNDLNATAVGRVCRRLDGIPLAIELAAARIRIMSPQQILARLDDQLRLLVGGSRTAPSRQQTLRATLDWSFALLDEPERAALRRFGVFAGGWSLDAAEAVAAAVDDVARADVLSLLVALVDRSLVVVDMEALPAQAWYRMLDTVRQYALEKLRDDDGEAIRQAHAEWYVALVEGAQAALSGPEQGDWLDRLEREHANLRVALSWAKEASPELALRLAAGLGRFWMMRGHFVEGRMWLESLLSAYSPATAHRARALLELGRLHVRAGDLRAGRDVLQESVVLYGQLRERRRSAEALRELGTAHVFLGDLQLARTMGGQALQAFRDLSDDVGAGWTLAMLGSVARTEGKVVQAAPYFEESIELLRPSGDPEAIGYVLNNLGQLARARGNYAAADRLLEDSLAVFRSIRAASRIGWTLGCLSSVALCQGDLDRADRLLDEARVLLEAIGDRHMLRHGLWIAGVLAVKGGQYARGVRLIAAGAKYPIVRLSLDPDELRDWDTSLRVARSRLGGRAYNEAWAEGNAMSLEEAIAYGLTRERAPPPSKPSPRLALTVREREVARLIVAGCSNREIAERLVISERTAEAHVSNLLSKAGLRSRAQFAVWAIQQGLT